MVDLSTLDELSPRDTEPVSTGDDAIRQTREAIKTTVGVEHDLSTGYHKLLSGDSASRPPSGKDGRLYINTVTGLECDNGTAWKGVSGVSAYQIDVWPLKVTSATPVVAFDINFGALAQILLFGTAASNMGEAPWTLDSKWYIEVLITSQPTVTFVGTAYMGPQIALHRSSVAAMTVRMYLDQDYGTNIGPNIYFSTQLLVI